MKHRLFVVITFISLLCGIIDLAVNYAILKTTSHEPFAKAFTEAWIGTKPTASPTPILISKEKTATPSAIATPSAKVIQKLSPKKLLTPVPSSTKLNK